MPAARQVETAEAGRERRKTESEMLELGTDNQRERWADDLLPESELLALARRVLFKPFADFRRWGKLVPGNIRHDKSCNGGVTSFSTRLPDELEADEWKLLQKIRQAVSFANGGLLHAHGVTAVVSLVEHVGRCSMCPSETYGRAASVRIEWAGRPLSREYSLEAR